MDFKDPQVQKTVIVAVLLVMIGYVYFFTSFMPFFFHPMRAKITTLGSEYDKMSAELEKARKMVNDLARLEEEYNRLHDKWVAAQSLLPQEKEVAELLRQVTRVGHQSGIEFELFEPQPPVQKEFITENPVHIKVRGGYHELGIFLSKVANLDRIVNVSGLKVSPYKAKGADETAGPSIMAELTMTAYTLVEGGEVSDESPSTDS
jgi:type IV pilus assembly protein PilO